MCDIFTDMVTCSPINQWGMEEIFGTATESATNSAWESICLSFAEATVQMLQSFANAFVNFPGLDLSSDGIGGVYGISLGLAAVVATLLLLIQIAKTAITHDGKALATGMAGVGKAALAFMLTLTITSTALVAADELSVWIIKQSFGSADGLEKKLAALMNWDADVSVSLILLLSLVGLILVLVLWFELLLRNAAIAVMIATSPIAAAGQVSESTQQWWSKLVAATIQLIVLKPVIALVFAVGFGIVSSSSPGDIGTMLSGMLVLLLAALAWPAIARFMTFAQVHVGSGAGVGAVLGFAAGKAGGGSPVGMSPSSFGEASEARTMQTVSQRSGGSASAGSGGAGKSAGAAGAIVGVAIAGLQAAQKGANTLTQRMEQTAAHAGIQGANPYAQPAGSPRATGGWPHSATADTSGDPRPSDAAPRVAPPPPDTTSTTPPTPPDPPQSAVKDMRNMKGDKA